MVKVSDVFLNMEMTPPSYVKDAEEESPEPPGELPKMQKKDSPFPDKDAAGKKAANITI